MHMSHIQWCQIENFFQMPQGSEVRGEIARIKFTMNFRSSVDHNKNKLFYINFAKAH